MGSAGVGVGGQVGRIKDAPTCCFLASNPLESVLMLQSLFGEMKTDYIACLGPAISPGTALPVGHSFFWMTLPPSASTS